jgi:hypothetical protein
VQQYIDGMSCEDTCTVEFDVHETRRILLDHGDFASPKIWMVDL